MSARVLPLALVVGLIGAGQSDSASALGPAILLSITVSPAATSITQGATQQFSATGTYSDLSTRDLTDSVTWSSSSSSTATVSNTPGSHGLATGVADGVATITATDPAALVSGTAALTVTSVATPVSPAPSVPQLALTPASGWRKAGIGAGGSGFTPGETITVTYLSGLKARKRASTLLCQATTAANGTFNCSGNIPRARRSGKKGKHMLEATGPAGEKGTANFTLVRPHRAR
ncbi:MAG TPA: Ig-like domain-containing protein [Acidimicrobiales bacterium]|nr:Ig-like domain-containing protein [Acidimicrobiales bacterium]